jgi:hypothetical protein
MDKVELRRQKIFNMNPTKMGSVGGWVFYEHPIYGDEESLMVVTPSGAFQEYSEFWEVPTKSEIEDYGHDWSLAYCEEGAI